MRFKTIIVLLALCSVSLAQQKKISDLDPVTSSQVTAPSTILLGVHKTDEAAGSRSKRLSLDELGKMVAVSSAEDVSSLASISPKDGQYIILRQYYSTSEGDGSGQILRYDASSTSSVDGGFVFNGPSGVGRYIATDQSVINAKRFGVQESIGGQTAAIQAVITKAATSGKPAFFPKGSYTIESTITVPADTQRLTVYGEGRESTHLNSTVATSETFSFGDTLWLRMHDLHLNYSGATGTSGHCIYLVDPLPDSGAFLPQQVSLARLQIEGFNGVGLSPDVDNVNGGSPVPFPACGVMLLQSLQVFISNCHIDNCGFGLYAYEAQTFNLHDSVVISCQKSGVVIQRGESSSVVDCNVLSNGDNDLNEEIVTTFDTATDAFTATNHGLSNGDPVNIWTPLSIATGYAVDRRYFVVGATANTFQLSLTIGGAAVDGTTGFSAGTTVARAVLPYGATSGRFHRTGGIIISDAWGAAIRGCKLKSNEPAQAVLASNYSPIIESSWIRTDSDVLTRYGVVASYSARIRTNTFHPTNGNPSSRIQILVMNVKGRPSGRFDVVENRFDLSSGGVHDQIIHMSQQFAQSNYPYSGSISRNFIGGDTNPSNALVIEDVIKIDDYVGGIKIDDNTILLSGSTTVQDVFDFSLAQDGNYADTGITIDSSQLTTTFDSASINRKIASPVSGKVAIRGGHVNHSYTATGDYQPEVALVDSLSITSTAAVNITDFEGGVNGQTIVATITGGNVTIAENSSIELAGSGDFSPASGGVITLNLDGTQWREVSRSSY